MGCCCGCNDNKNKKGSLLVYLGVFVLIAIVVIVGSCKKDGKAADKVVEAPKSAAERTQLKLEERMSDFDYTNTLHKMYLRQTELANERAVAVRAFNSWYNGWVSTNAAAKALSIKIAQTVKDPASSTNGVLSKLRAEMDALVAKDAVGTTLKAKITDADGAIAQHQGEVQAFIGNKLHKQAQEAKNPDFARKREEAIKKAMAAQAAKNGGKMPKKPQVRKEGWWTNSAPYKAAAAQAATNNSPKIETKGAK